jgi:hypothetical protein
MDPSTDHPPAARDWRVHVKSEKDPGVENWTSEQFSAYYWFIVSHWRSQDTVQPMQLTMPRWERIEAAVETLLRELPKPILFAYMFCVVSHFNLIKFMIGKAGPSLVLNEGTLTHGLVRQAAESLRGMTPDEYQAMVDRFHNNQQKLTASSVSSFDEED